jgi:integrase
MPRKVPSYRQRKGYDQALVTLHDTRTKQRRDYWLGPYGSAESRERYHRVIAEWEANARRLPGVTPTTVSESTAGEDEPTVAQVILAYWRYVESYYQPTEAGTLRVALRMLRRLYGQTPASAFGPKNLRLLREEMVRGDEAANPPRAPWSRGYVNHQVKRIRRMFKWAASHEMIPVAVHQHLATVEPLKRGRSNARETDPVLPVPIEMVHAIEPHVSRQVWALVQLQLLTGARGGELLKLRPIDLTIDDRTGVWTYSPKEHKNAYRSKQRVIFLGPKAQAVIEPFLADRPVDAYLFSPAEADAERRAKLSARRKTPLKLGNAPGTNVKESPAKKPADHYTAASYYRAIQYACDIAFPPPAPLGKRDDETTEEWHARLTPEQTKLLNHWRTEHRWHPHQLRHAAGTEIRRQFGLEAAQLALGHCSAQITDAVYAERDTAKVIEVMKRIG